MRYLSYSKAGYPSPDLRRPPRNRFSPRLAALRLLILATWPGTSGGSGYVVRLARALLVWSAHAYGGAWDCYLPPAAQFTRDEICAYLVGNADAIGIQLINDYHARRVWTVGIGWKYRRPRADDHATGWGWKGHLHIEIHPSRWADTSPLPAPWHLVLEEIPIHTPRVGAPAGWVVTVPTVQHLLGLLGYTLKVDGIAGPRTRAAVRDFQASHGLKVDGIVGLITAGVLTAAAEATR